MWGWGGDRSLCTHCKAEHEEVAVFAHETVPCVLVVAGCSLREGGVGGRRG